MDPTCHDVTDLFRVLKVILVARLSAGLLSAKLFGSEVLTSVITCALHIMWACMYKPVLFCAYILGTSLSFICMGAVYLNFCATLQMVAYVEVHCLVYSHVHCIGKPCTTSVTPSIKLKPQYGIP